MHVTMTVYSYVPMSNILVDSELDRISCLRGYGFKQLTETPFTVRFQEKLTSNDKVG